jgi:hypothetical protein
VQFRSLHSLARRTLAAGAASALALTLFNAVQPTLGIPHQIGPGTLKDVPLTLVPTRAASPGAASPGAASPGGASPGAASPGGASPGAAAAGAVDSSGSLPSGSATLPLRGAEPGPGSFKAAPAGWGEAGSVQADPARGAELLSAPVAVGKARFVGVSWPAPAVGPPADMAGRVWLRARTGDGWSGWREVEPAADGPDADTAEYRRSERVYSDGQWLDPGTTEVQVRVDQPAPSGASGAAGSGTSAATGPGSSNPAPSATAPSATPSTTATPRAGVQAHLITPDMTATPGTEGPRAGVATAATARPAIVSRKGWGAVESLRRAAPDYSSTVKAAVVHHTVQTNRYAPSESAALVRADYLYHVRSRGWNDIGYNFLVDRYGRVFEGRYGGITRAVLGAHAGGFNTYTTGVALLGTFSAGRPPAAMVASLKRLLAWKLDLTHVDPTGKTTLRSAGGANVRFPAGRKLFASTIFGHRSTSFTDCPGSPTLGLLRSIRTAVARIGRPKIYGGRVSAGRVQPERGTSVAVAARFSSKVRWRVTVTGSNRATVRTFAGVGAKARVRWSGRTAAGTLPPPGWATVTVSATAGEVAARPAVSRVFVDRTAPPAGTSTGGFSKGVWRVSNVNAEQLSRSARAFASYRFGRAGDLPVVGDWDGDGTQTVGVVRPSRAAGTNRLLLRNSRGPVVSFTYGRYGDRVLVGDWDGNGTWTPAAVRAGVWSIRNSNSAGPADRTVRFGQAGDRYLAGDWDGDRDFTPAVQRGASFWFRNSAGSGPAELHTSFGRAGDLGFVGDWNGNGTWTPGVLRGGVRWYLKNSFTGGPAAVGLAKQTPGTPVVGDWDNRP